MADVGYRKRPQSLAARLSTLFFALLQLQAAALRAERLQASYRSLAHFALARIPCGRKPLRRLALPARAQKRLPIVSPIGRLRREQSAERPPCGVFIVWGVCRLLGGLPPEPPHGAPSAPAGLPPARFASWVSSAPSSSAAIAPAPELCGLLRGRVGVRAPLSSQPPLAPIVARPHGRLVVPTPYGRGERSRLSPRSLFLRGSRPASSQPERRRSVFDFAGRKPRRKRRLGRQLFALSSQQRASACLAFLYRSA